MTFLLFLVVIPVLEVTGFDQGSAIEIRITIHVIFFLIYNPTSQ